MTRLGSSRNYGARLLLDALSMDSSSHGGQRCISVCDAAAAAAAIDGGDFTGRTGSAATQLRDVPRAPTCGPHVILDGLPQQLRHHPGAA